MFRSRSTRPETADSGRRDVSDKPRGGAEVESRTETDVAPPSMYRVLLVNDDYTPREFVVAVLIAIFQKAPEEAARIMMSAHQSGKSVVGVYTYDVAASRTKRATTEAKDAGFPLLLYTEEV
jgi:ATP-dependent Clp protease adaptor protein ClpS